MPNKMPNNFCSLFMGKLFDKTGKKILDSYGNPISTIFIEDNSNFLIGYRRPKIIYDIFEEKMKTPKIIVYGKNHDEYLKRLGVSVIAIPIKKRADRWLKFQRQKFELISTSSIPPLDSSTLLIPNEHFCEHDINNSRIRICGKYAAPGGIGEWLWL